MAGRVEGKVAFVTGAARGQGRSHAVRLAQEGARVVAVDICGDVDGMNYPLSTPKDLQETVAEVEAVGGKIIASAADVRDVDQLCAAARAGAEAFGPYDVVAANAGIGCGPFDTVDLPEDEWQRMLDVNLTGAFHTIKATVPLMNPGGGSVIMTSSAAGLKAYPNIAHYVAAKHGVVGLMRALAVELGPRSIRVNSIHSGPVRTPMLLQEGNFRLHRPDLENPTEDDLADVLRQGNVLPVPYVMPEDMSNALLFLASDEARYVTGIALPVDAGALVK